MLDRWGREIDYLRISLTDRCNLRCMYCMPEVGICQVPREELLDQDEIVRICSIMAELGISRIKITGGEPLVRKICIPLIKELKSIPGIRQVTLTTNGVLLEENLPGLLQAGLDGINISLDTLDRERFWQITRRDEFEQVKKGLKAALSCKRINVKINCVPTIQTKEELVEIARVAKEYPVHVRFIEMMPVGLGQQFTAMREASLREIFEKEFGEMTPFGGKLGNGPCHYFSLHGFQGKIGYISALSHKFCDQCNRIRLTSVGYLKGCLQFEKGADLRALLRNGSTDEILMDTIKNVIYEKLAGHNFLEKKNGTEESHIMSQIGG